jgi:hypothetical protein
VPVKAFLPSKRNRSVPGGRRGFRFSGKHVPQSQEQGRRPPAHGARDPAPAPRRTSAVGETAKRAEWFSRLLATALGCATATPSSKSQTSKAYGNVSGEAAVEPLAQKGEQLLTDDFARAGLGEWKSLIPTFNGPGVLFDDVRIWKGR